MNKRKPNQTYISIRYHHINKCECMCICGCIQQQFPLHCFYFNFRYVKCLSTLFSIIFQIVVKRNQAYDAWLFRKLVPTFYQARPPFWDLSSNLCLKVSSFSAYSQKKRMLNLKGLSAFIPTSLYWQNISRLQSMNKSMKGLLFVIWFRLDCYRTL